MHDIDEPSFEKENYMESGRPAGAGKSAPGRIVGCSCEGGEARFATDNGAALWIVMLEPTVARIRFAPRGHFSDGFSYAIADGALDRRAELELSEESERYRLKSPKLVIFVSKDGLRLRIEDLDGGLISEDEAGFHWEDQEAFGGQLVYHSRHLQAKEHFYGLGDKSCEPNLRGRRLEMWGSDTYGYGTDTDPLYKNVPFFVALHHGRSYGIFFDNSFRSFFDFGEERSNVSSFWAQGGEMDFYFMSGPQLPDVVAEFSALTGTAELPPRWALGFHQCKWSYRTEEETRKIASTFRELSIPCDAIYLDIDYMDGFRCFTWNKEAFPDPRRMIAELREEGFKTVAMIDPGIKVDRGYEIYQEGLAEDVFCKRMDGDLLRGTVWPGPCHFPDFTNPRVRDWWADLYRGLLEDDGIAAVWNDMNEPAIFNDQKTFPRDVRHDYDGHPSSHRKAHNIYGMQMARATHEGLRRHLGGRRPFVITRSAYAGTWRYSSAWTGDNVSSWEHLRIANVQCQRLALSGYSFIGSDIGGFLEEPEGELFTRWIQMGIFHPFCRVHSSGDKGDQEPWSFGDPYTSVVRKFLELRYRLLPYLYTAFWQHTQRGTPILRPLVYLDPSDPEVLHRDEEFGVGDALLVCPVSKPKRDGRWLYAPSGRWYEFWTDTAIEGGDEIWADAPLDKIPLYVRAGAVLPLGPVRQFVGDEPEEELELHLYAPAEGQDEMESLLYEDAGEGEAYREGECKTRRFTVSRQGGRTTLRQKIEGDFEGTRRFLIVLHGFGDAAPACEVDGKALKAQPDKPVWVIPEVAEGFGELSIG